MSIINNNFNNAKAFAADAQAPRLTISTSREAFEAALAELDLKSPLSCSTASCASPTKSFDWAADDLDDLSWDDDVVEDNLRLDTKTGALIAATESKPTKSLSWAGDDLDDLDWDEDMAEDNLRIDTRTGALVSASVPKDSQPVYQWGDHLKYRYMPTIFEAEEPVEQPRKRQPFVSKVAIQEAAFLELAAIADDLFTCLSVFEIFALELATAADDLFTFLSVSEVVTLELAPISASVFTTLSIFETIVLELAPVSPSIFSELSAFELAVLELAPISATIFSDLSIYELAIASRSASRLEQLLAAEHDTEQKPTLEGYKAASKFNTAKFYRAALQRVARCAAPAAEETEYSPEVDSAIFHAHVLPRIQPQVEGMVLRLQDAPIAARRANNWKVNDPWPVYYARQRAATSTSTIRPPPGLSTIRPPPGLLPPPGLAAIRPPPGLGAPAPPAPLGDLYLNDLDSPAPQAPLRLDSDLDWESADLVTVRGIFPLVQDVPGPGERFANYRRNSADACRFDHPAPAIASDYSLIKKQRRALTISAARFNYNSRWAAPQHEEPKHVAKPAIDETTPEVIRAATRATSELGISELSVLSAPASICSGRGLGRVSTKTLSILSREEPATFSWRGLKRSARGAISALSW